MLQTCDFTKNEHYDNLFFKAFDYKCAITTSYHIFLQNNYFCRAPLENCFCVWKIQEFLRQISGIIRKVPCYQSTTVLRSFIVEVRILRNAFKIYLEQLPVKISLLFFYHLLFLFMRKQKGCIFVWPDFIQLSNLLCGQSIVSMFLNMYYRRKKCRVGGK